MNEPGISIVVPVFNSEKTLEELCRRILSVEERLEQQIEIILVDDCSKDKSWEKIKAIKKLFPQKIKGIRLLKNAGQHKALMCGFHFTKGKYIITIDDDLQTPPEELTNLYEHELASNADVVYGIYPEKRHSAIRNLGHKLIEKLFKKFASTPGKGSSFKLLKASIAKSILTHNYSYIYIDELISWYANSFGFVEVMHTKRKEGKSGYNLMNLLRLSFSIIINYTILPLRLITYFGLISAVIFFIIGIYFIYMKYTYGSPLGFTALIVAIFFSTGLILFSLGIIGEYINRIFAISSQKPSYIIKEILD